MATTNSNEHRVEIIELPPWTPPYSLPSAGAALAIGTNSAESIRPGTHSNNDWHYSLFNSFGGGTVCPDYSDGGAYVIAASGGHGAPENFDGAIFDFEDATWKYLANANGKTNSPAVVAASSTTGSPYFEMSSHSGVPAPVHLYGDAVYLPPSLGGGTKGSFLKVCSMAVCEIAGRGGGTHRFDLATGQWSRLTNSVFTQFQSDYDSSAVLDEATSRIYFQVGNFHAFNYINYLDLTDMTVKSASHGSNYPSDKSGGGNYGLIAIDTTKRWLIKWWGRGTRALLALDLANIGAGWVDCTARISGSTPSGLIKWAFNPTDGRWYARENNGGNTIYRLTPPAAIDSGTWTADTFTATGSSIANRTTIGGLTDHFTGLVYVPSIDCLAWFAGGSSSVYIIKPPA